MRQLDDPFGRRFQSSAPSRLLRSFAGLRPLRAHLDMKKLRRKLRAGAGLGSFEGPFNVSKKSSKSSSKPLFFLFSKPYINKIMINIYIYIAFSIFFSSFSLEFAFSAWSLGARALRRRLQGFLRFVGKHRHGEAPRSEVSFMSLSKCHIMIK